MFCSLNRKEIQSNQTLWYMFLQLWFWGQKTPYLAGVLAAKCRMFLLTLLGYQGTGPWPVHERAHCGPLMHLVHWFWNFSYNTKKLFTYLCRYIYLYIYMYVYTVRQLNNKYLEKHLGLDFMCFHLLFGKETISFIVFHYSFFFFMDNIFQSNSFICCFKGYM